VSSGAACCWAGFCTPAERQETEQPSPTERTPRVSIGVRSFTVLAISSEIIWSIEGPVALRDSDFFSRVPVRVAQ
jgi:hypothetical protein